MRESDQLYGSYAIAKLAHPETFVSGTSNSLVAFPFPIIRLGELYLDYERLTLNTMEHWKEMHLLTST